MSTVGTASWAYKSDGILTWGQYLGLHKQLVTLQLKEAGAWLAAKGIIGKKPLQFDVDEIVIPDSAIARKADELVRDVSSAPLHSHCVRTYVWGYLLGKHAGLKFDPELFYVSSVLHDLGLVEPHIQKAMCACFAVTGAKQAREFVRGEGWSEEKCERVFETISLHLNLDVRAKDHFAEAQMLAHGAHLDVVGAHYRRLSPRTIDSVIKRFPRDGFVADIQDHIETPHNPLTRATMLGRVGFSKLANKNPLNDHQMKCHGHL
ncbi:hypothetical protein RA28_09645 [Ruegeria sp. ANG-S4]|uniref:HD domain-containing protein n=1 Tax=Ruegeria sp. ANG-S4 TaxID=1577904 RepID=UPI0005800DAA|nr:HD domain-containing protein [Ruegeria sp. ANG-S4]KIC45912.1 hypothetical protein RA28_09645 [Ruegeria sp. ANG-S4]